MNTESPPRSTRRFLAQWFRREMVTFACTVAVVTGLLLTVGTQDGLHNLPFSWRFCVPRFLTVLVLYAVALSSYAQAGRESAASLNRRKRQMRLGSND